MEYRVESLIVGHVEVPGPELFWMQEWGEWYPLRFQVVLIRAGDVVALVNSGTPSDLGPLNEAWTGLLGPRATMTRGDDEWIEKALASVGVTPADVTHLILTPFQLYTTSNVKLFTKAKICVSKAGWIHFHTTHNHPHDARWGSIPEDVLVHMVTEAWDRMVLLDDEDEVAPGIRTWNSATHHRASMVIEVETEVGVVAISDSFFYYENVEEGRILGITENMYEAMATNKRVLATADHIVPLYDPKVYDRYPGGVIAQGAVR